MIFNRHTNLIGNHAFLSPSTPYWLNYDEDKLAKVFKTSQEASRGTALHEFAALAIRYGEYMPRKRRTLNLYVNDCIKWKMTPEQPLYYSRNCYGHVDAISFRAQLLRISDLKTGVTKANLLQLLIYAGLFCLEYGIWPFDITTELRIYQSNDVSLHIIEPDRIVRTMETIKAHDRLLEEMRWEDDV